MLDILGKLTNLDPANVSAWASVGLMFLTFWLAILTRVLARETKTTREVGERADVQCSVESHEEHVTLMELAIANLGRAAAVDVRVTIQPIKRNDQDEPLRTLVFTRILPAAQIRMSLGTFLSMTDKIVDITVDYNDKFGKHTFRYQQDLKLWLGMARVSSHPEYEIAKAANNIEQLVRAWTRGGCRPEIATYSARDRREDRQSKEEGMDGQRRREAASTGEMPS